MDSVEPLLDPRELEAMRRRADDPVVYHNIVVAQEDRRKLLRHVDFLQEAWDKAQREVTRLRGSTT
jgi:hypothetical protein